MQLESVCPQMPAPLRARPEQQPRARRKTPIVLLVEDN
jgi:hypothetical protein